MLKSLFLQSCFFKFPSFINLHSIASAFSPYGKNECKYVLMISRHDPNYHAVMISVNWVIQAS